MLSCGEPSPFRTPTVIRTKKRANLPLGNVKQVVARKRSRRGEQAAQTKALPMLLHCRETGCWKRKASYWIDAATMMTNKDQKGNRVWRPFARTRSIPFSQLGTNATEAVLALDRSGSYLICLGGGDGLSPLSLRFYATPSPAGQEAAKNHHYKAIPPLVQTVPLACHGTGSEINRNDNAGRARLLGDPNASSATSTPTQLLLSCDLGVAFVLHSIPASLSMDAPSSQEHSHELRDEDTVGSIIVFPLPDTKRRFSDAPKRGGLSDNDLIQCFMCANVRIGGYRTSTMRNLLHHTTSIPHGHTGSDRSELCAFVRSGRAYLLFNDEDDGFRLTWITLGVAGRKKLRKLSELQQSRFAFRPKRKDIMSCAEQSVWEESVSHRFTGVTHSEKHKQSAKVVNIEFEAYLHADALLMDILDRRRKMFGCTSTSALSSCEFFYNLISVKDCGASVLLVITFTMQGSKDQNQRNGSFGVFIHFNLYTQQYSELEWVRHPSPMGTASLRQWSNALALNQLMRERGIGPFSVPAVNNDMQLRHHNWGISPSCTNFDRNECTSFDDAVWTPFVNAIGTNKASIPKQISYSSLYPDCDLVTNRAVLSAKPVHLIECRDAPTRLVYG